MTLTPKRIPSLKYVFILIFINWNMTDDLKKKTYSALSFDTKIVLLLLLFVSKFCQENLYETIWNHEFCTTVHAEFGRP